MYCRKCETDKHESQFYYKETERRYHSWCSSCLHAYQINRWIDIKKKAIEYKGGSCRMCRMEFPYPAMQFHHLDPSQKDVSWTKLRLRSWDRIALELDKCILLCANCHSVVHSNLSIELPAECP